MHRRQQLTQFSYLSTSRKKPEKEPECKSYSRTLGTGTDPRLRANGETHIPPAKAFIVNPLSVLTSTEMQTVGRLYLHP
uniref:Uncharacterized protein n=1 Tax=Anguilla anguilla TaxID=7936 RepID=A0A0E9TU06_ANGAN